MQRIALIMLLTLSMAGCSWFGGESTRPENPVVRGISYVGMTVSDLDASTLLYQDAAALVTVTDSSIGQHPLHQVLLSEEQRAGKTRLLKSANAQLNLMMFDNPSDNARSYSAVDVQGPGIAHVCYQVNQNTNTYQKFLAAGATHVGDEAMVHLNPKRPVYYAYARDADGVVFEVEHVDVASSGVACASKEQLPHQTSGAVYTRHRPTCKFLLGVA